MLVSLALSCDPKLSFYPRNYQRYLHKSAADAYKLITDQSGFDKKDPFANPDFRCHAFRNGLLPKLDEFAARITDIRSQFSTWNSLTGGISDQVMDSAKVLQLETIYEFDMFLTDKATFKPDQRKLRKQIQERITDSGNQNDGKRGGFLSKATKKGLRNRLLSEFNPVHPRKAMNGYSNHPNPSKNPNLSIHQLGATSKPVIDPSKLLAFGQKLKPTPKPKFRSWPNEEIGAENFEGIEEMTSEEKKRNSELSSLKIEFKTPLEDFLPKENANLITQVRHWAISLTDQKEEFKKKLEGLNDGITDFGKAGRNFARLLIYKDYVCLDEIEFSFALFKVLYLQILPAPRLEQFLKGIISYLEEISDSSTDPKTPGLGDYAQGLLKKFYGFNLFVLLGLDNQVANDVYTMVLLDEKQYTESKVAKNFIELYRLILGTIRSAEDYNDTKEDEFVGDLFQFKWDAVKQVLTSGSVFAFCFGLKMLKGYLIDLGGDYIENLIKPGLPTSGEKNLISTTIFAGKTYIDEKVDGVVEAINDFIEEHVPNLETKNKANIKRLTLSLLDKTGQLETENFQNFYSYFAKIIESHNKCVVCKHRGQYHKEKPI